MRIIDINHMTTKLEQIKDKNDCISFSYVILLGIFLYTIFIISHSLLEFDSVCANEW